MIRGLISGVLTREPEARQSKAGNPYTMASIREGSGDKTRWISAFVFADEARAAVAGMAAGDAISVSGEIEAEVYVPENNPPRISWSIRADAVLTAQTGARKRTPEPREIQKREGPETRNPAPIDDDIAF